MKETTNAQNKSELYLRAQEETVALCIYNGDAVTRVSEIVSAESFLDERFHSIMRAIVNVSRRDEPVSVMSVANELDKSGELKFSGGVAKLYELYWLGEKVSLSTTPTVVASIVKESYTKTVLKDLLKDKSEEFVDDSGTTARDGIEELTNELTEHMLSLNDDSTLTSAKDFMGSYSDLLEERRRIAEENMATSGGLQGIPTLLPSLNKYTSGFTAGQLVTIGAQTGVGKSVFAVMCAVSAIKAGKSVLFFSLEMSHEELFDRIIANMSEVKLNKLKNGNVTDEEKERVLKVTDELLNAPLTIDTDAGATIDSVRSKAIRQQQTEEGLDFIIVDYLQLLSSPQKYNSRQEQIADLSRNMKLLAKTLDIPVMILTQLNRNKSDDEEGLPELDQIRESGAIAQDSDIVILLHREKSIDNKIPQTLVLLKKNRNGESDKTIRCHTELAYSDFREVKAKELSDENNETNENNDDMDTNNPVANFYDDNLSDDFDFLDDSDFFDEE